MTSSVPGALIAVSGVIAPLSRPAVAVTTLKVEPGGYWPWVARLKSGEVGSWLSSSRCSGTRFGSYGGFDASTLTRPVDGSIATTAPNPTASQPGQRDPLRFGVEVGDDVVAFLVLPGELVEDRPEFRFFADQLVVVELLELGVALAHEAVPDRVPEQRPFGVAPT